MRRLVIGAAIAGITLLNVVQFPGHTWLGSDTQIYMPILEHIWDPGALDKDLVATHPHVAFTLYDETAIALRKLTGLDFRHVLQFQQVVFRILGIWGVYLIATALGLSDALALLVTAVFSLGATILGPSVLIFEYEPVPRGFAVPLIFFAIGLAAHHRYLGASAAGSAAFLIHPPTAAPFWAVYFCLALWSGKPEIKRERVQSMWLLAGSVVALLIAARIEAAAGETQAFFTRLTPHQEQLQQLRTSYNWISLWWNRFLVHYLILYAATLLACWRLRDRTPEALRFFLVGLPLIGMLSMPASYLLLEKVHWALIPQFQPMRNVLFVTAMAMILGVAAGCRALADKSYAEAVVWMALAYIVPANREVVPLSWNRATVIVVLALIACMAIWAVESGRRWSILPLGAAVLAPFFLIPGWGHIQNYSSMSHPEIDRLAAWASAATARDAVFLFPTADQDLTPGVFRVEAERAVYVDWKSGGQVNFFQDLGEEWWSRWQKTMAVPFDPQNLAKYRALRIDYLVLSPKDPRPNAVPVFENAQFVVFRPAG
ncbi:MAG TPA: DUF6798 domain-containing protein [Bryobacteraceae bacterium]|nr:DUF6798 domain-containing protein [Bryobacteraceae bacterium]